MLNFKCQNCTRSFFKYIIIHRMGYGQSWTRWKCPHCESNLEFSTRSKVIYWFIFGVFATTIAILNANQMVKDDTAGVLLFLSVIPTEIVSRKFVEVVVIPSVK